MSNVQPLLRVLHYFACPSGDFPGPESHPVLETPTFSNVYYNYSAMVAGIVNIAEALCYDESVDNLLTLPINLMLENDALAWLHVHSTYALG